MISVSRKGPSLADVAASMRDVPARMVPYAASTALTRVAQFAAKSELPAEMRRVFASPVAYTINSLRIEPATKDALSARVMVKNDKAGNGVAPENFLFPEVNGGPRKHKRAEMAMRYAGVLRANQFAVPGAGLTLDANGNVKGNDVKTILTALKSIGASSAHRTRSGAKIRMGGKLGNDLFVGKPKGGNRPDGIWRREGQRLRALFVFTNTAPNYSQRLDFSGVVQKVAMDRFPAEFKKAVAALQAKDGSWT